MKHVPMSVKWRTFAPQIVAFALTAGCATGIAAVNAAVAIVPLACGVVAFGLFGLITTIGKAADIDEDGWPEFEHVCVKCRRLAADLEAERISHNETRNALVELRLP